MIFSNTTFDLFGPKVTLTVSASDIDTTNFIAERASDEFDFDILTFSFLFLIIAKNIIEAAHEKRTKTRCA